MRNFLTDINIVGGIGVWSEGEICRYSIENLVKYCDKVCIMEDNSDEKTHNIVLEYKEKYPDVIEWGSNGLLPLQPGEGVMQRQKKYEGQLIEECFKLIKKEHEKKPIDILIFMDSDEILTENISKLLPAFWTNKVDTIFIKPIEVFDSMNIIVNKGLISHAKIYKYRPDITSIPYGPRNYYKPYSFNRNIWKEPWNFVHLDRLLPENRLLRNKIRNRVSKSEMKLFRINKPAYELVPDDVPKILYGGGKYILFKDYDGDIDKLPLNIV